MERQNPVGDGMTKGTAGRRGCAAKNPRSKLNANLRAFEGGEVDVMEPNTDDGCTELGRRMPETDVTRESGGEDARGGVVSPVICQKCARHRLGFVIS